MQPGQKHDHKDHDRGNSEEHRQDGEHRPPEPPGHIIKPRPVHGGHIEPPRPVTGGGPLLAASVAAMQARFPQFTYDERSGLAWWTGTIQPIQTSEHLEDLLDDLAHDRPVFVADGGAVLHDRSCTATHCAHDWMHSFNNPFVPFTLEILHDGTRRVPRAYVLAPHIPEEKRRHMWSDGAICPLLASTWSSGQDTVADFVPHVSIWLMKWLVFDQTAHWIGSEHDHSPQYHLGLLSPKDLCWCGSGRQYRRCHRDQDRNAA